ncbi:phosphopentomutase, partial [Bacillus vallismortis]|nr:phosphopentomutase [Bacillus vallismortis]
VPILAYSKKHENAQMLPLADTIADIGATIADNFQTNQPKYGKSFLSILQ